MPREKIYITHNRRRLPISEWARRAGVSLQTACTRYRRGERDFRRLFARKMPSRTLRLIKHGSRMQCIAAWAREIGMSRERLRQRLEKYPVAVALGFEP